MNKYFNKRKRRSKVNNATDLKARRIYELLLGMYDLRNYFPPEAKEVESLFQPGSECSALLEQAYAARRRLGRRLGTGEEDADLLQLVECYEAVSYTHLFLACTFWKVRFFQVCTGSNRVMPPDTSTSSSYMVM